MPPRQAIAKRRLAYRYLTALGCALAAAAVCLAIPMPLGADAALLDFQIAARARIFPPGPLDDSAVANSPVAVVALDRRTLDAPELAAYPRVFFEPGWAAALTAVMEAGAKAAGFDEIFAYDPNTFPGIGPNFALPFLATLHKNRGHVVLARSATTLPARPFAFSVGFDSLGLAEISQDPDGSYRHVESTIDSSAGPQPTLSALVLNRAGLTMPASVLVAPRRHLETIPTYSMIDVIRCARGGAQALHDAFGGKIVLFGGTLPEEDRKPTAARFLSPLLTDSAPAGCGLRRMRASAPTSNTVPGVFLHAGAVEAVATGDLTSSAPPAIVAMVSAVAAGLGAIAGLVLAPWTAVGAVAAMVAMLVLSTIAALQHDYWIPLAIPVTALVIAPGVAYSMRYLVEDRARRHVQHAFGRYLAPAIVDRLAQDPSALTLGGELREITVMFADLSGFTAVSARLAPEALTAAVNRYLGYIVEQVEKTEGYVDKFIGDAVMAFWGAPAGDPDHARNAVRAAIAAAERIQRARAEDEARGIEGFEIKIGINSGPALVGNVGTERRYNYTAVGEAVNLASRLEHAPDLYSCEVVIGPRTAELLSGAFLLRELDWLLVKGAKDYLAVYEPIAERDAASAEQVARAEKFAEALKCYRVRRFGDAASIWEGLAREERSCQKLSLEQSASGVAGEISNGAAQDNPPAVMARRARGLVAHPPAAAWNGVYITNPEVNDDVQS